MTLEISFDLDVENSAPVASETWLAAELERVAEGRRQIAGIEAAEIRMLAAMLLEAEGSAGEDAIDAGNPAEVTRRHELNVRSVATELAATLKISVQTAEQRLGEAWTLANELRDTLSALEAGEISRAHAHEIVLETAHLTATRVTAQKALLPWARELGVSQFRDKARRILETLEKESLAKRHQRALAKRRIDLTPARDGMARLEAYLELTDAVRITAGLQNAAQEARQAGDARTATQLEADLAVELLLNGQITITSPGSATGISDGGAVAVTRTAAVKERAQVTVEVLIPADTLAGKNDQAGILPGYGAIDPVKARELVALAPSLRRILTDPITGAILEFDRSTYRVPAALKRVLKLRDQHCRAPGCNRTNCELDHTRAHARGGPTALGNLAHLCANHHHLKHEAGWSLTQYLDGVLEWRAPSGRTYRTYPEIAVPAPGRTDPWAQPDTGEPAPFDPKGLTTRAGRC